MGRPFVAFEPGTIIEHVPHDRIVTAHFKADGSVDLRLWGYDHSTDLFSKAAYLPLSASALKALKEKTP